MRTQVLHTVGRDAMGGSSAEFWMLRRLAGQDRGNQEHEREEGGPTSYDSEDSGSFPSSDDSPGGRYVVGCAKCVSCRGAGGLTWSGGGNEW